jgi:hypothetical protein
LNRIRGRAHGTHVYAACVMLRLGPLPLGPLPLPLGPLPQGSLVPPLGRPPAGAGKLAKKASQPFWRLAARQASRRACLARGSAPPAARRAAPTAAAMF